MEISLPLDACLELESCRGWATGSLGSRVADGTGIGIGTLVSSVFDNLAHVATISKEERQALIRPNIGGEPVFFLKLLPIRHKRRSHILLHRSVFFLLYRLNL